MSITCTCMYAALEAGLFLQDDYNLHLFCWRVAMNCLATLGGVFAAACTCLCGWQFKNYHSNFQFNPLKLLHCLFCCSKWRRISGYYDGGYMKKWPRKEETTCIFCWKISGHSCQQLHIFVKEISKQRCKLDLLLQYVYARKSFICNVTANQ